jgi:hypothetical protein
MEVGIAGAGGMVEHSSGANFLEANHIAFAKLAFSEQHESRTSLGSSCRSDPDGQVKGDSGFESFHFQRPPDFSVGDE